MKRRADFIIPECYIDTNLAETLLSLDSCNHQRGCNQVAKVMREKFADRFAVGIIDADKRTPGYLKEFKEITGRGHLRVYRHAKRAHFMILVHPATDGFILSCANVAGLCMKDYDLSTELKEFTSQTKNVLSNKDVRFKKLFKAMENVGEIKLMKKLLNYLVTSTYSSTDEAIAKIWRIGQIAGFFRLGMSL